MNISTRDRALLGVVAALAVVAAFYVLVLTPQRHQADHLDQSITAARSELATAQKQYADGRSAQTQLNLTSSDFTAAQRAVPGQSNIPALLRLLQTTANAAHVTINSVSLNGSGSSTATPAPAVTTTPTPTTSGTGTTTAPSAAVAQPIPVALTFGGGYQALNRMVHQLDDLVRVTHGHLRADGPLVAISNVALSPGPTTGSAQTSSSLTVTLSANIYQYADASTVTGVSAEGSS